MDIGFWTPPKIDDVDAVVHAEQLGYRSVWLGDSQMIWSDCYAVAALVADRTTSIRIGPGVAVAGTRIAPVTAAAIATINRIAPGRTFIAIGRGDSGWRMTGHRPVSLAAFEDYVRVVRGLVSGSEVEFTHDGRTTIIGLQMADHGFVDVEHPIPIWLGASGPRVREIAGRIADGIVGVGSTAEAIRDAREQVRVGMRAAGREPVEDSLPVAVHIGVVVLDPGEDRHSPRVIEQVAPGALVRLHAMYIALVRRHGEEGIRAAVDELPEAVRPIWEEYCDSLARTPISTRHSRVQAGHFTYVHPDEARFLTPGLIESAALIGGPEELAERVREIASAGASELLLVAPPSALRENLERFSRLVMTRL